MSRTCEFAFLVEGLNKAQYLTQVMYTAYPHNKCLHLHSRYGGHTVRPGDDLLLMSGVLNTSTRKFSLHAPLERIVSG